MWQSLHIFSALKSIALTSIFNAVSYSLVANHVETIELESGLQCLLLLMSVSCYSFPIIVDRGGISG